MSQQHKEIPDAYLHEPKGVASASSGQVYVADGAGSGSWATPQVSTPKGYGCMYMAANGTDVATTAFQGSSFKAINDTNMPGCSLTWTISDATPYGITQNTTNGYHLIGTTGAYMISATVNLACDNAAANQWRLTFGVDTGSGIVSKEANAVSYIGTTDVGLIQRLHFVCIPQLAANTKVYLMLNNMSGGNDVRLYSGNFTIVRVG